MARTKVEKKEIVDKVQDILGNMKSLVFVNFHGLKVGDTTTFRRKLRENKIDFFVAKKTLTKKAIVSSETKIKGDLPDLPGEIGLAYGKDLVAPARGVREFSDRFKGSISIVGGIFDGKFMNKEEMTAIALIPPTKTLQAMFVNVINSPIQGFVMALSEISKKK